MNSSGGEFMLFIFVMIHGFHRMIIRTKEWPICPKNGADLDMEACNHGLFVQKAD